MSFLSPKHYNPANPKRKAKPNPGTPVNECDYNPDNPKIALGSNPDNPVGHISKCLLSFKALKVRGQKVFLL